MLIYKERERDRTSGNAVRMRQCQRLRRGSDPRGSLLLLAALERAVSNSDKIYP
jgi:hypothetical protein